MGKKVMEMEGVTLPFGFFDPLGFTNDASDELICWYREAELKHGRVAMAAFVGFLVNYSDITFPANLTMSGEKFSSLGAKARKAYGRDQQWPIGHARRHVHHRWLDDSRL